MRSINKVIIIGNLTRSPEMRQTPNGQNVTTFGIATNREWMTRESEKKSSAEFHECVAWARLAEICANYLKKGHLVYVEGYLKTRSWETPEGIKKFKTEIVVKDKEHQGNEENQADHLETFPGFHAQRLAADGLHNEKNEMPAIQDGNGEKIQHPEADA